MLASPGSCRARFAAAGLLGAALIALTTRPAIADPVTRSTPDTTDPFGYLRAPHSELLAPDQAPLQCMSLRVSRAHTVWATIQTQRLHAHGAADDCRW